MKRIVFVLFIISIISLLSSNNKYIIPNKALRFRIVANSNDIEDQMVKAKIKNELEPILKDLLKESKSSDEANKILKNNLPQIESIINNKTSDYKINLGLNYFPKKEYKNVIYKEGYYDSLVITLGSGLGNNWWCVLYPPLCFIDEDSIKDKNYGFFIKDLFSKFNL